jgi:hypothetical protein
MFVQAWSQYLSSRFSTCAGRLALVIFVPFLSLAAQSKPSASDPCVSMSRASTAASARVQARCAKALINGLRGKADDLAIASTLARSLAIPEFRLMRELHRLNGIAQTAPKRWRDLTLDDLSQLLASASSEKEEASESREEWMRRLLGDENGFIPPDGLSRALEQRNALVREPSDTVHAQRFVQSPMTALPSSPAGWTNLTGYVHPVGRVNALLIHPTSTNTMWAGTDGGGIWKTTDAGVTWAAANDFLGSLSISGFAMRPGDTSTIYAATGAQGSHTGMGGVGIYKSTDGGTTWPQLTATDPTGNADFQHVFQLAIHPTDSNTVLAATDGGAYLTTNGGTNWTKVPATTTRARNVAIHPANGNLRVLAMDDGTVKIATDGSTYNTYTIAASTTSYTRIALAPSNQSIMYALLTANDNTTHLYRSSTTGTTWSPVTPPANFFYDNAYLRYTGGLWVDPTNANHIAVVEGWGAVTSDASLPSPTWTQLCCGWTDFHGVVSHPSYDGSSNKTIFFFDDGGLYKYTNADSVTCCIPNSGYLSANGIVATEAYSAAGRGGSLVFGAQDVAFRFYKTNTPSDPTQKWRFALGTGGSDGAITAADRTNPLILYGSTQALGLYRSTDGGANASLICQGITDITCGGFTGNSAFIAPYILDPNNQSRMLAGAASLWRSNDVSSGTPPTWTAIHSGTGSVISAIAIAPSNSDVIWVSYFNGNVYKTANGTATTPTWTPVSTVPVGFKLRILIDRTDANRVYIGLSGFVANRLVTTPDGGTTWSPVSGLPNASVMSIQQHPIISSWLYAGTAVGLFASEDGGATWSTSNQGPANVQIQDLNWYSEAGSNAVLTVATFGRGIWQASASSLGTPAGLIATAGGTTSVSLTWSAATSATGYKILRSSNLFSYSQIGTSVSPSYTDSTAAAGTSYLYVVRATDGSNDSPNSSADLATTVIFTDPTLIGGTVAKTAHISELRTAVNAVRVLAGIGATSFTDPTLSSSINIKGVHVTQLRTALDAARSALALTPAGYTDTTITGGATKINATHINELRLGVK